MDKISNRSRILIVDDEEDLCEIIRFNLMSEGYLIDTAFSAEEALQLVSLKDRKYSLILLDVMMSGISGFKMAEILRTEWNNKVPIVFLTAKDTENDMLTGFNLGADDYISKPFSIKELIARVKAIIKRSSIATEQVAIEKMIIELGEIKIDKDNKQAYLSGNQLILTRKEYEILLLFISNPNKTFTRDQILTKVWGEDQIVLERTVDVHITRLRKKLGEFGSKIVNRSNYGYSLNI